MCSIGTPYGAAGVIIWQFGLRDKGRALRRTQVEGEREREKGKSESARKEMTVVSERRGRIATKKEEEEAYIPAWYVLYTTRDQASSGVPHTLGLSRVVEVKNADVIATTWLGHNGLTESPLSTTDI